MASVATAGDRRDEDIRELGRVAARYFDEVIVREDRNPRGRKPGETAELVMEGIREGQAAGGRVGHVDIVLDEMDAVRAALDRARPGDLVLLCVDYATETYQELESSARRRGAVGAACVASSGSSSRWAATPTSCSMGPARPGHRLLALSVDHGAIRAALDERLGELDRELAELTAVPARSGRRGVLRQADR